MDKVEVWTTISSPTTDIACTDEGEEVCVAAPTWAARGRVANGVATRSASRISG